MAMRFLRTCVGCHGEDVDRLNEMIARERPISRRTFRESVDRAELSEIEASLGYESHCSRGLTMAGDWHVSYHRSVWGEKKCVFFRWSAIEHIFVED